MRFAARAGKVSMRIGARVTRNEECPRTSNSGLLCAHVIVSDSTTTKPRQPVEGAGIIGFIFGAVLGFVLGLRVNAV